jgi:hypothetical protein
MSNDIARRHVQQRPMRLLTDHELDVIDQLSESSLFRPHIASGLSALGELAQREMAERDRARDLVIDTQPQEAPQ